MNQNMNVITKLVKLKLSLNKCWRKQKGKSRMDNPKKLAIHKAQHEDKPNKKHNTIFVGHHFWQINTNNVNKT